MVKINLIKPKWRGYLFCLGFAIPTLPKGLKFMYNGTVIELDTGYIRPAVEIPFWAKGGNK